MVDLTRPLMQLFGDQRDLRSLQGNETQIAIGRPTRAVQGGLQCTVRWARLREQPLQCVTLSPSLAKYDNG